MSKLQAYIESTIVRQSATADILRHNEEVNGKLYKYDLPLENEAIEFKNQLITVDEDTQLTPLEKLFERLEVDKNSSFESLTVKLSQEFNNEVDMYGNI